MTPIHIMPALLLQKPSKTSKSKDHVKDLERRLRLWREGEFLQLFRETETLQQCLPKGVMARDLAKTSKQFRDMMTKGNVKGA